MPSLPFTFEDLRNLDIPAEAADRSAVSDAPQVDPQEFLGNAVDKVKERFTTTNGLIDTGLALNPVTRVVDMGAKFFGQPGIQEGFTQGTTMTGDVRVPRMPF